MGAGLFFVALGIFFAGFCIAAGIENGLRAIAESLKRPPSEDEHG